jgi:hypothetical protein
MEVCSTDSIQLLLRLKGEYDVRKLPVTLFSVQKKADDEGMQTFGVECDD